jgi:hypothetical protein
MDVCSKSHIFNGVLLRLTGTSPVLESFEQNLILRQLIEPFIPAVAPKPKGASPRLAEKACLKGILLAFPQRDTLGHASPGTGLRVGHTPAGGAYTIGRRLGSGN